MHPGRFVCTAYHMRMHAWGLENMSSNLGGRTDCTNIVHEQSSQEIDQVLFHYQYLT